MKGSSDLGDIFLHYFQGGSYVEDHRTFIVTTVDYTAVIEVLKSLEPGKLFRLDEFSSAARLLFEDVYDSKVILH